MSTKTNIKEYPLYLNGKFEKIGIKKLITNPYDGKPVGYAYFADKKIASEAIGHAGEGFKKMKSLPTYKRAEILDGIARGIEENLEEIARTIALEAGKPIKYARGEASRCIITFRTAAEEAKRIGGEVMPLDWAESARNRMGYTRRFPIGIIFGITPFNFPLNLAAHKIAPAMAAGNSIILKPASTDPISALWLARLAHEAGAPAGSFQVLPASAGDIQPIIQDERVKMISFTGSAGVGWSLKAKSGKKRIALELGGNAGAIVDKECDIDYAVQRCLMGSFAYAGQVCISVQRIFIHSEIYDDFVGRMIDGVKKTVKVGDPLDDEVMMSALIREEDAKRVESWVNEAVDGGAKILAGGKREGSVYMPTILTNVKRDMKVYKDEIFGPVVLVDKFDTFDEAVRKVDDSRYGLQAGVFTRDLEKALFAYENIEVGGVMINDVPTFRIDPMPYGGLKDSGVGREGLKYAIEEMTEQRLMVINRS
ncbi:MAG: aldehyde dehydrogenase family protein [Candidatus Eremiobacteraeota bacterium]|nr:aldehyde dehydrogenase family protein [Candidatus Eremiobacteraeota bacterium]